MDVARTKAVVLVEDYYEDLELWYPYFRLKEEKADVSIAGPQEGGTYQSKHGYPATSNAAPETVDPASLDALVIPGGYAPDHMRRTPAMVQLVQQAGRHNCVVAYICHGGWMAASADLVRGKRVTSFFAIKDDMVNAGAEWVDAETVQDGNLVSARKPSDLPVFCKTILKMLKEKEG